MSNWGTEVSGSRGGGSSANIEWLRKCRVVEQEMSKIHDEINRIERDNSTNSKGSHYISEQLHHITDSLKNLTAEIVKLDNLTSQFPNEGGEKKNNVRRLHNQALEESRRIQKLSSQVKNEIRQRSSFTESKSHTSDLLLFEDGFTNEVHTPQQYKLSKLVDPDIEAAKQEEQDMRRLEGDIVQVNEIFTTLAGLVHEQGELVDSIEANTTTAHVAVAEGEKNLRSAVKSRDAARKKKCILVIILLVVLAVIGLAIGLSIHFKSN